MKRYYEVKDKYEVRPEWTQQTTAVFAGLIGIGLIIVQAFLSSGASDTPATISVLAFALAIPLLAALVMLNNAQAGYKYVSYPWYYSLAIMFSEMCAFVGVAAAFWHLSWIAGVLVTISGVFGLALYIAFSARLEKDNAVQVADPSPTQEPKSK